MRVQSATVDSIDSVGIILGSQTRWYQVSPGKFSATLERTAVGPVRFTRCRCSRAILMRTRTRSAYCTLLTQIRRDTFYNFGKPLRRDILISTDRRLHMVRFPANCDVLVVEIPLDLVEMPLPKNGSLSASLERLALWNSLQECSNQLFEQQKRIDLASALFGPLLAAVNQEPRLDELCESLIERRAMIRLAQTFIEEKFPKQVTVRELCKHLEMPERTVRSQFEEVYGLPPSRMSKIHRLMAARRMLESATPGTTSVKTVAGQCGFTHLSHFTQNYRKHFERLPSHSLSQVPEDMSHMVKLFESLN